ncbi:hypothetical protein MMC16_006407 [Acarospora aff. strigata]|nr:hypothetical protein [Acarospora aff. strigata]
MNATAPTNDYEATPRKARRRQRHRKPRVERGAVDNDPIGETRSGGKHQRLDEANGKDRKHTESRVNRFAALRSSYEVELSSLALPLEADRLPSPEPFVVPQSTFTFTSRPTITYASVVAKPVAAVVRPTEQKARLFRRSIGPPSTTVISSDTTQTPSSEFTTPTKQEILPPLLSQQAREEPGPMATPTEDACQVESQSASATLYASLSSIVKGKLASALDSKEAPVTNEPITHTTKSKSTELPPPDARPAPPVSGWPAPSGKPLAPLTPDRKSRFFPVSPSTRPANGVKTIIKSSTSIPHPLAQRKSEPVSADLAGCQGCLPRLHGRSMSTTGDDSEADWGDARMIPSEDEQSPAVLSSQHQGEENSDGREDASVGARDEEDCADEGYYTASSSTEVGSDWEGRDEAFWA